MTKAIAMRIVDLRMEGTELSFNRRRSRASTAVISERLYHIVGKRRDTTILFALAPEIFFTDEVRAEGRSRQAQVLWRLIASHPEHSRRGPTTRAFPRSRRG